MERRLLLSLAFFPALLRTLPAVAAPSNFDQLLILLESGGDSRFAGAEGRAEAKLFESTSFGAAQPSVGKSSRSVSARATRMIAAFEVSSRSVYERRYRHPVWPHGASGVTIGVGYDLGYVNPGEFEEDWKNYIAVNDRNILSVALGFKGNSARDLLAQCESVAIPFDTAYSQFIEQTLPKYVALTEHSLPNTADLSADSLGALASLTFNRGASYTSRKESDSAGRYLEMREIRRLMRYKEFSAIPAQIRAMKRLWQGRPEVRGLLERRDMEADLFELGLS